MKPLEKPDPETPAGERPAPSPSKLGEWAARLLLLCFALASGLGVAELAVRLLRPQAALIIPDGLYRPGEDGAVRLQPGYRGEITNRSEFTHRVSINSRGMRGGEIDPEAGESLRILAVGDSFTFGVGVEEDEVFVSQLASILESSGTAAAALNGGVPGYGVPDAVDWLEDHRALDPDLVLLAVFVGNDLQDAAHADVEIIRGFVRRGETRRFRGVMEWLYYNSHLFLLVKNAVPTRAYQELRARLGLSEALRIRNLRQRLELFRELPGESVTRGREATDQALARLLVLAAGQGAGLAAILIPDIVQVDAERWQLSLHQLGVDGEGYDRHAPTRIFRQLLAGHQIPTLDLTAPLTAATDAGERVYFPADRHWTPAGHRLAAELLADFLDQHGLIGSATPEPPESGAVSADAVSSGR